MATLFLHELRYYLTTYTVHQVRKFQMLCLYKRIETCQLDVNGMIQDIRDHSRSYRFVFYKNIFDLIESAYVFSRCL